MIIALSWMVLQGGDLRAVWKSLDPSSNRWRAMFRHAITCGKCLALWIGIFSLEPIAGAMASMGMAILSRYLYT